MTDVFSTIKVDTLRPVHHTINGIVLKTAIIYLISNLLCHKTFSTDLQTYLLGIKNTAFTASQKIHTHN